MYTENAKTHTSIKTYCSSTDVYSTVVELNQPNLVPQTDQNVGQFTKPTKFWVGFILAMCTEITR